MTRALLAVFDVDRTCVDGMTGFIFSKHLLSRRAVSRAARWDVVRTLALYRLGLTGEEEILRLGATVFRGLAEREVREAAAEAFHLRVRPRMLAGAIAEAKRLAEAETPLILASGSSRYIIEPIAEELRAECVVATDNDVRDGMCTDRAVEPYCFGRGKVELLERALRPRGLGIEQTALFTDNYSDLPLLERCAEPHAVNPDPALEEVAQRRGWPVHHWTIRLDGTTAGGTSFPIKMRRSTRGAP